MLQVPTQHTSCTSVQTLKEERNETIKLGSTPQGLVVLPVRATVLKPNEKLGAERYAQLYSYMAHAYMQAYTSYRDGTLYSISCFSRAQGKAHKLSLH